MSKTKVATVQFYLPADGSQRHYGTSIYRQQLDGRFETARTLECRPNSGYGFAVTDRSWHEREEIKDPRVRHTLLLTYFQEKAFVRPDLRDKQ